MVDAAFLTAAQAAFESEVARILGRSPFPAHTRAGTRWTGREQVTIDGPVCAGELAARDLAAFLHNRRIVALAAAPVIVACATSSGVIGFAWRMDATVERSAGPA